MERVTLTSGAALPSDRRWAIAHGAGTWNPNALQWIRCGNFVRVTFSPRLAQVRCALNDATGQVDLTHPDLPPLSARPDESKGANAIAEWIAPLASEARPGPYRIARAPGAAMTDAKEPWVSIKSLNSLSALSKKTGLSLDPLRFRGNLWIERLTPWAELDWIGREVMIGAVRLRVTERIGRCAATAANPDTGIRDTDLVRTLRETYGHTDFGVYAEVIDGGEVALGDKLAGPE